MKSRVSFELPACPLQESGVPTAVQPPPYTIQESIEIEGSHGACSSTAPTASIPAPAFSNCPICRSQVEPEGVLPENASLPVPVSMGVKPASRWTRRQWLLLAMYAVLTVIMGLGLVGAFRFMGPIGILYTIPVFVIVIIAAYCLTQSKREKKRQRNTIILRNCKTCRQRLHLKAQLDNKTLE